MTLYNLLSNLGGLCGKDRFVTSNFQNMPIVFSIKLHSEMLRSQEDKLNSIKISGFVNERMSPEN